MTHGTILSTMRTLLIVYASTSGHTEFVVDVLMDALSSSAKDLRLVKQRAEQTKAEDLTKHDATLLASSTWNTGNVEGQLNPHMFELLNKTAAALDLKGKPCAAIGLGDERYYFTARATDKLVDYLKGHNGAMLLPPLKVVNEPYGQEDKITGWAAELLKQLDKLPGTAHD